MHLRRPRYRAAVLTRDGPRPGNSDRRQGSVFLVHQRPDFDAGRLTGTGSGGARHQPPSGVVTRPSSRAYSPAKAPGRATPCTLGRAVRPRLQPAAARSRNGPCPALTGTSLGYVSKGGPLPPERLMQGSGQPLGLLRPPRFDLVFEQFQPLRHQVRFGPLIPRQTAAAQRTC
jgi:hypothetical protein